MKIIFAGTPEFAAVHLQALIDSEHEILAVYTQPDRPSGRGKKLTPSPVKALALQHALPVVQVASLKSEEAQAELASYGAELMVVVAYGLLLPKAVLDIPPRGCINVHGSILPRWRGAAPIQRAVEAGDTESGVTIMQMDVGLDTGDMLLKAHCPILPTDTASDLHDRLADIGPPALLECMALMAKDALEPEQQDDSQSNYAKKLLKEEALIQWSEPSQVLSARIRAFNPFPICYSNIDEQRIRIHYAQTLAAPNKAANAVPGEIIASSKEGLDVATGQGVLRITRMQLAGKKPMSVTELVNGSPSLFATGKRFS